MDLIPAALILFSFLVTRKSVIVSAINVLIMQWTGKKLSIQQSKSTKTKSTQI